MNHEMYGLLLSTCSLRTRWNWVLRGLAAQRADTREPRNILTLISPLILSVYAELTSRAHVHAVVNSCPPCVF